MGHQCLAHLLLTAQAIGPQSKGRRSAFGWRELCACRVQLLRRGWVEQHFHKQKV